MYTGYGRRQARGGKELNRKGNLNFESKRKGITRQDRIRESMPAPPPVLPSFLMHNLYAKCPYR